MNTVQVNVNYRGANDNLDAHFYLNAILLESLSVTTPPTKTAYRYGEIIDYGGLVVAASYDDGSTADVTSLCSISPQSGKAFDPDYDSLVDIVYREGQDERSCSFSLTRVTVQRLEIFSQPTKTAYKTGEAISYSGIVVKAIYSDDSEEDVTSGCTFSPVSGATIDSDTTVAITYGEQTCTLLLTVVATMSLVVDTMPTKTSYDAGETVDYTGVVIKAVYSDGTEHTVTGYCDFEPASGESVAETVTVSCAPPATPYVFDQNSGYVAAGAWVPENPTDTYIDIYQVLAGHKYLLTLGPDVGTRFRGMFTTTDIFQATARVNGTNIINTNDPAPYANVEYTPSTNGYIVVGKDNIGKSGISTYLYDADAAEKSVTTTFNLTLIGVESIAVTTNPVKTSYAAEETIDYAGLVVTATLSDGSTVDVTSSCSITPAAGKAFDPQTDTDVLISYSERGTTGLITETASIILTAIELTGIAVTQNPHKTAYSAGEPIDYAGLVVTASYSDGSTEDVTNLCSITPADGKAFDPETDTDVEISYGGQTTSLFLTEKYLTGIEVTHNPYQTAYKKNERISYDGMVVTASYSDGSTFVVTRKCKTVPANNKRFDPDEDTNVEITYAGMSCSLMLTPVLLTGLEVTQKPNKTEYFAGEAIDYTGVTISGVYSDGSKEDVTEDCVFSPVAGTTFGSETEVTITYEEQTCGLTLTAANDVRLIVSSLPEKTGYKRGDTISYKGTKVQAAYAGDVETAANYVGGIEIQASYSDGTVHTVTDYCSFSPAEGATINGDTEVTVSCARLEPYAFDINNGYVDSYGTWRISQDGSNYSDVYRVTAGHHYLIAMGTEESFVYYVLFISQDITTATSTVSGGTTLYRRSKNGYDNYGPQSYTPSSSGYLVITKSTSGAAGIKTYLYDADSLNKNLTTSFYLTVGELMSISVTQPVKARYKVGEAFDYTGVIVSAKFTDGHIENVTEDALFSPPNGTIAASDGSHRR